MSIYAIAIQKGGSGKTTTAFCLGSALKQRGEKVLYIDLDAQRNLSLSLGIEAGELSSFEVLNKTCNINEAIKTTQYGDIVPGSYNLITADMTITETGKEYRLKEALEELESSYDSIVIDTPPGLGILTVNALTASNEVIIPAQAELYSVEGLALLNRSIETVKRYTNKDLSIGGILITRYNPRTNFSKSILDLIENYSREIGSKVYGSKIRECISLKESQALQKSIFDYAPRSNASEDYNNFVDEVIKDRKH